MSIFPLNVFVPTYPLAAFALADVPNPLGSEASPDSLTEKNFHVYAELTTLL
jgi:hypothetical protein